jgi:hypothetical protein
MVKFMVDAQVFKLSPSSFIYITTFWVKKNLSNNYWTCKVIATLVVLLGASNKVIITCLGCQFSEIKFTITTNTSCVLISTSKDQRHTWLTHKWLMWVTHIEAKYFTLVFIELFQQKPSYMGRPLLGTIYMSTFGTKWIWIFSMVESLWWHTTSHHVGNLFVCHYFLQIG